MPQPNPQSTIIVGAGWAGLAAAVSLARQGKKVLLLEAAPQAGGRARTISWGNNIVDNGQHLLIGAYQQTLSLLNFLNIPEHSVLYRMPLEYYAINALHPSKPIHLQLPAQTHSLKFLTSLLDSKGLSWYERFKALQFGQSLKKGIVLTEDISVQNLLLKFKQPASLIEKLWAPLALAALSTPITQASAEIFCRVMTDAFINHPSGSDWLLPKKDLSEILPNPILNYLSQQHSSILYHQRAQRLIIENGRCTGVQTEQEHFQGAAVILATPPHITAKLLQAEPETASQCHTLLTDLTRFHYQPITTLYLQYPKPIQLPLPMIGLIRTTGHWLFDRRLTGQPNLISVVISGEGAHTNLDPKDLTKILGKEIAQLFPRLNISPVDTRLICEKRAAFSCEVGINRYRPPNTTPISNLWLAGDYTKTGYPATLEGAIQSGIKSAQLVLSKETVPL